MLNLNSSSHHGCSAAWCLPGAASPAPGHGCKTGGLSGSARPLLTRHSLAEPIFVAGSLPRYDGASEWQAFPFQCASAPRPALVRLAVERVFWTANQAGFVSKTITNCPRLPPSVTMVSFILSHGFWWKPGACAVRFGFPEFQLRARFRREGAPQRVFHADEICRCGLLSSVFETWALTLARKHRGVHYVESGQLQIFPVGSSPTHDSRETDPVTAPEEAIGPL